jgi:hypothetical protein
MTGSASEISSTAALSYRVAKADVNRDEAAITNLWRIGGLGGERSSPQNDALRYDWFYRQNPQGSPQLTLLYSNPDSEPAGFLGVGARTFHMDGMQVPAGVLVDFVTSPRHRSAYPALTLQRQARAAALPVTPIVYGLPDTKAVLVCRRLEAHVQADMQRWVRVIRSRAYFERKLPGWLAAPIALIADSMDRLLVGAQLAGRGLRGEWMESFDQRFEDLWNTAQKSGRIVGVRGRDFLEWRFRRQPGRSYRIFGVTRAADGKLISYFVCESAPKFLVVKDCFTAGSSEAFKTSLLLLSAAARRLRLDAVSAELVAGEGVLHALRRAQFVQRSHRPFFAVVHESIRESVQKCEWFITPADEDV